jgi:hypothetical protein
MGLVVSGFRRGHFNNASYRETFRSKESGDQLPEDCCRWMQPVLGDYISSVLGASEPWVAGQCYNKYGVQLGPSSPFHPPSPAPCCLSNANRNQDHALGRAWFDVADPIARWLFWMTRLNVEVDIVPRIPGFVEPTPTPTIWPSNCCGRRGPNAPLDYGDTAAGLR